MLPFLESCTVYYSPTMWKAIKEDASDLEAKSLEISATQKQRTDIRLTLEPSAVWGSTDGLIVQCALRFGDLGRMGREILGKNTGLLVCPHTSTSKHGSVSMYNSHTQMDCPTSSMKLEGDLNEALSIIRGKSARRAARPVRGCMLCPTDFQILVNNDREVVVMVWRILGKNEDNSILMGMCEPDEHRAHSVRSVKSGEVKREYERLCEARACRL